MFQSCLNLGLESIATGFTAGFTGEQIKRLVQEMEIQQNFIEVKKGCSRINVEIRSGVESEINGKGPEVTQQEVRRLYQQFADLKEGDVLVLAGSVPEGLSDSVYYEASGLCGSTENGNLRRQCQCFFRNTGTAAGGGAADVFC